jgi:hypothetical protein
MAEAILNFDAPLNVALFEQVVHAATQPGAWPFLCFFFALYFLSLSHTKKKKKKKKRFFFSTQKVLCVLKQKQCW